MFRLAALAFAMIAIISFFIWGAGAVSSAFTVDPDAVTSSIQHPTDRKLAQAKAEIQAEREQEVDDLILKLN
jgi:hypothetical protein